MFSRIFLFILLLTCVYTHILKSIKDNKDTNFQKLPDNFNFELNDVRTAKANLKVPNMAKLRDLLSLAFGIIFVLHVDKYTKEFKEFQQLFNKDLISKLKACNDKEGFIEVFDDAMVPTLKKDYDDVEIKNMKDELLNHMDNGVMLQGNKSFQRHVNKYVAKIY